MSYRFIGRCASGTSLRGWWRWFSWARLSVSFPSPFTSANVPRAKSPSSAHTALCGAFEVCGRDRIVDYCERAARWNRHVRFQPCLSPANYESLPAFKPTIRTARSRHQICFSPVRSFRHGSDGPAIIQHRVARRVLAILRRNRIPTRHRYGPICADDPSATRIRRRAVCLANSNPPLRCREVDRNPP